MRDLVIVGGGIVGMATALVAQQRLFDVTVVDAGHADPASWGNAGHIAIEQVDPLAALSTILDVPRRLLSKNGALGLPASDMAEWLPFAWRLALAARPAHFRRGKTALADILGHAMPAWERLTTTLAQPSLLRRDGHFIVWERPRTARRGLQAWLGADVGTASVRPARADELRLIGGLVKMPLAGGARCEGTGQIADPGLLANALRSAFLASGGTLIEAEVAAVTTQADGLHVHLSNASILRPERLVIAAGIGSKALLEPLGMKVPMIAERGYHIEADSAEWPLNIPPVVFEDRSLIVTRFTHSLRAASFVEFARPSKAADPAKWARIRSHIEELGLPFLQPQSKWMGARPTLPDYLPAIGRSRDHPSLFYAFGHQHLGLTLGPITGEIIGALLTETALPVPLGPFGLDRFQ